MSEETVAVRGLSSETTDNQHVLFWDLEPHDKTDWSTPREWHRSCIKNLQTIAYDEGLPEIVFIDAGNPWSRHAICPLKVPDLYEADRILSQHPHRDPDHGTWAKTYGRFILRVTRKPGDPYPPQAIHTLEYKQYSWVRNAWGQDAEVSTAHIKALHGLHGAVNLPNPGHHPLGDGLEGFTLEDYETTKTREETS